MDLLKLVALFALLLGLLTASQAVNLGEDCHPLIPSLQCTTGRGIFCTLQKDNVSYKCECGQAFTSDITGTYCRTTYDAGCLNYNDCNLDRRLECYPEVTWPIMLGDCWCSGTFVYSTETESCVARVGQPCDLNATAPFGLTCVNRANCESPIGGGSPSCRCHIGYEANWQGRCVKIGGLHGDSCDGDEDCDYGVHHLQCREGSCSCAEEYAPNLSGVCFPVHGARCSSLNLCDYEKRMNCSSTNAGPGVCHCEFEEYQVHVEPEGECRSRAYKYYYGGAPCVPNASLRTWPGFEDVICTCDEGYVGTHEGECRPAEQPELGDICEEDGPPCAPDTYSVCSAPENSTTGHCACPSNRNSNVGGHLCHLRYAQRCNENDWEMHCNTDRHLECDQFVHLCRCFNQFNTVFDPAKDACLVLVGGKCTDGSTEFDMSCVDNAECGGTSGCVCKPGSIETPERTCVAE